MQRKNSKSSTFPGAHGALGHHAAVLETRPSVAEAPAARKLPPPRAVELPPPTPKTEIQARGLYTVLSQLMPFVGFERDDLNAMVEAMTLVNTANGQVIAQEGQELDVFYIVEHGKFQFWQNGAQVGQVKNVGHFSELALLYDVLSEHTIVSASPGQLWVLHRAVYRDLLHRRESAHRIRLAALLEAAPALRRLSADALALLCQSFTAIKVENGCIVDNWATADAFFLVEEGAVVVRVRQPDGSGQQQDIAVFGRGSSFGALTPVPSPLMVTSVFAMGTTKCAVLSLRVVLEVLGPHAGILDDSTGAAQQSFGNLTI